MKNLSQNIGLCRKAGKLVFGFDACVEVIKNGTAKGVLTASDISPKTLKEINFYAQKYKTEVVSIPADMTEIKTVLGKHTGVIVILDEGLYNLFK